MSEAREINEKEKRVKRFLEEQNLKGLLISKSSNFAWFTAGKNNHVLIATEGGVASILVTRDKKYIIANNIETPRMVDEEIADQGFEVKEYYWWEDDKKQEIISNLVNLDDIGSDDGFAGTRFIDIAHLRYSLTKEEIKRYRWLGKKAATAMEKVCKKIKQGETENEISARLAKGLLKHGITPVVLLMAADERISKYRHPIPTDKEVKNTVMVVTCARKFGLICSLTRIVHFGKLNEELRRKHDAVAKVDATFIVNSKPGELIGDILAKAQKVYKDTGFENEWKLHHQGGPTGYNARDFKATPGNENSLVATQAVAWNPSITGTKSEDTIIVGESVDDVPEIISISKDWPMIEVEIDGIKISRPDILCL